jgi:hypothetical protein
MLIRDLMANHCDARFSCIGDSQREPKEENLVILIAHQHEARTHHARDARQECQQP